MPSPPAAAPSQDVKRKAAREVIDILFEIATLLVQRHLQVAPQYKHNMANNKQNTRLDRQQLSYCVSLIENGANPEALAVRATLATFARACESKPLLMSALIVLM
jgi:hypothetical protein